MVGLDDTTDRLKVDGSLSWSMNEFKSLWEKREIDGHDLYRIEISLSSLAGNHPTANVLNNLGVNRFSVYAGAGDINPTFTIDGNGRI